MNGYAPAEVEEYIELLLEKYTDLYREANEIEKQLNEARSQFNSVKSDEDSIKLVLINAQKASAKIMKEANEKADAIVFSTKNKCDKILSEFKEQVSKQRYILKELNSKVANFRNDILCLYKEHIESVNGIAPLVDDLTYFMKDESLFIDEVVSSIKTDLADEYISEIYKPEKNEVGVELGQDIDEEIDDIVSILSGNSDEEPKATEETDGISIDDITEMAEITDISDMTVEYDPVDGKEE